MTAEKVRVLYMGQEISHEELPEPDAVTIEDYFAPVSLSGPAIDMASKIVPEEYWKPQGLHTWLSGRANAAFKKMPTTQKEIKMGRLKYVFNYTYTGPELKTVSLI